MHGWWGIVSSWPYPLLVKGFPGQPGFPDASMRIPLETGLSNGWPELPQPVGILDKTEVVGYVEKKCSSKTSFTRENSESQ